MILNKIYQGNVLDAWPFLDKSLNCIVTSPPYWGLRDYKVKGQLGMEKTPEEYVEKMVRVFREAWRCLRKDGTFWLNLGDTYMGGKGANGASQAYSQHTDALNQRALIETSPGDFRPNDRPHPTLKAKQLVMIPARVAIALQADGWILRQDIIWHKKNCMPESVTDRCTKSHEHIFMFVKQRKYFYNHLAIQESAIYDINGDGTKARKARVRAENKGVPDEQRERAGIRPAAFLNAAKFNGKHGTDKQSQIAATIPTSKGRTYEGFNERGFNMESGMRNKRDVWSMATAQFPDAHYAVFPEELPYNCISAGCPTGGLVCDPFTGSGTTFLVAQQLGRDFVGLELSQDNIDLSLRRLQKEGVQKELVFFK